MQVLVILIIFSKHLLFLTIDLRCFYKILSEFEIKELLYLLMAFVNYFLEKTL